MAGYISIHTTRKVVTIKRWWESLFQRISIHTTRKVVTPILTGWDMLITYFNPHHPQGGDKGYQEGRHFNDDFNPHHPQGGDTMPSRLLKQSRYFNPHHPQGGDNCPCQEPED